MVMPIVRVTANLLQLRGEDDARPARCLWTRSESSQPQHRSHDRRSRDPASSRKAFRLRNSACPISRSGSASPSRVVPSSSPSSSSARSAQPQRRRPQCHEDDPQQGAVDDESTDGEEELDLTSSPSMSLTDSRGTSSSISTAGSASNANVVGATTSLRSERMLSSRWRSGSTRRERHSLESPSVEKRKGRYTQPERERRCCDDAQHCTQCRASYKGFGDKCASCRKSGPEGDYEQCKGCSAYFCGYGATCDECLLAPEPDMVEEVEDKILMTQEQLDDFTKKAVETAIKVQTEKHSQQLEEWANISRDAMVNMLQKEKDQYNQKEEDMLREIHMLQQALMEYETLGSSQAEGEGGA